MFSLDAHETAKDQLVHALTSDQSELSGFNHVLREATRGDVAVSADPPRAVITIAPSAAYSIVEPETLRLTLPAATVSTRLATPVSGVVVINATAGNATPQAARGQHAEAFLSSPTSGRSHVRRAARGHVDGVAARRRPHAPRRARRALLERG